MPAIDVRKVAPQYTHDVITVASMSGGAPISATTQPIASILTLLCKEGRIVRDRDVLVAGARGLVTDPKALRAFDAGIGFMRHLVSADDLHAVRSAMTADERKAFDLATSFEVGRALKNPAPGPRRPVRSPAAAKMTAHGDRFGFDLNPIHAVANVANTAVDLLHDVPGVDWIGDKLKDFSNTSFGKIATRAFASSLFAPMALVVGPQLAAVSFAVPGLMRGEAFDEAWTHEFLWRLKTLSQILGPQIAGVIGEQLDQASTMVNEQLKTLLAQSGISLDKATDAVKSAAVDKLNVVSNLQALAKKAGVREDTMQAALDLAARKGTSFARDAIPAIDVAGIHIPGMPAVLGRIFDPKTGKLTLDERVTSKEPPMTIGAVLYTKAKTPYYAAPSDKGKSIGTYPAGNSFFMTRSMVPDADKTRMRMWIPLGPPGPQTTYVLMTALSTVPPKLPPPPPMVPHAVAKSAAAQAVQAGARGLPPANQAAITATVAPAVQHWYDPILRLLGLK